VSYNDPIALAHAQNKVAEVPKVLSGDHWLAPAAEAPPIEHHRGEERPSMLDNLIDMGKKAGGFLLDNLPTIATGVGKLLSKFL